MKILIYATHPFQTNGYSKVGLRIANYLCEIPNHKIYYFAITNYMQNNKIDRKIHPNIDIIDTMNISSNDPYGMDIISQTIQNINPDLLFLYNDILVLSRLLQKIENIPKTFQTFVYMDIVYRYENLGMIDYINQKSDKIFVFTEYWKTHLQSIKVPEHKLFVLQHGLDTDFIFPIDKQEARKTLQIVSDDFIILNTNKNVHRKGIDITITSFLLFLKKQNMNKNIKILLNMDFNSKSSYDIESIIMSECHRLNMNIADVFNNHIYRFIQGGVISDTIVNLLYNASDIGINTCYGEGFGLCNLEHGCVGRPQIMTKTGGLIDIFQNLPSKQIEPSINIYSPLNLDSHGGIMQIGDANDFADAIEYYYIHRNKCKEDGDILKNELPKKYNWNEILSEFVNIHLS